MKKTAAQLAIYALEQIGVRYTFGIPGVHNTELYDELNKSEQIEPILVTHEGSGAFMADAVSRTSDSIGCMVIVPAAGTTHAMSGMGEAYLDGIPMMVITGGTRTDSDRAYQLHALDQQRLVAAITKGSYVIQSHQDVIPTIYEAYNLAISGEPGPVFIEIPVNLQMFQGNVDGLPAFVKGEKTMTRPDATKVSKAVELLVSAKKPAIFVGWGAVDASDLTERISSLLVAPIATSLQGKSSVSARHPYAVGVGFGPASKPAAQNTFKDIDCMLAVGVRFGELATGSYGIEDPPNLIHIDINPKVFDKNYKTTVAIEADAHEALSAILKELENRSFATDRDGEALKNQILKDEEKYVSEWLLEKKSDKVSPGHFFKSLRALADDDAIMAVDDGKHTFLASELFPIYHPRHFISPTDFNCMGYCTPACIAVKLVNPDKQVLAIVGDGAFMMTCMELVTASTHGLGPIVFVFHDGELGQISQFQSVPLNRKTCSIIGQLNVEGVAIATGAHFIDMPDDHKIASAITEAISVSAQGRPVIVDVNIDYSKKTMMTKGVIKTTLKRFALKDKVRFISRAVKRQVLG